MVKKRCRPKVEDGSAEHEHIAPPSPQAKRAQLRRPSASSDLISPLSDELLLRILSHLPIRHLLAVAKVSHRFHRLAGDSHIWKALYYQRFVAPCIIRWGSKRVDLSRVVLEQMRGLSTNRWIGLRRAGLLKAETLLLQLEKAPFEMLNNWKRQYKIRHNWLKGRCAVDELKIGTDALEHGARAMLVKVIEGIAITADKTAGLRVWDLQSQSRELLVGTDLNLLADIQGAAAAATPTCIAVDDQHYFTQQHVDIAVGLQDGRFGVWRLHLGDKTLMLRYRHQDSTNGELVGVAYSYPYLLTATSSVQISLYAFDKPTRKEEEKTEDEEESVAMTGAISDNPASTKPAAAAAAATLAQPYLLTSLRSHSSQPPLALSIRKLPSTTIASIAYTFITRQGWAIGMQDLHIKAGSAEAAPEIQATRLAHSVPISSGRTTPRSRDGTLDSGAGLSSGGDEPIEDNRVHDTEESGPIALCYNHPYLLATLPDNTLVLHLCTSTSTSLSLSPGVRLWGHTSGISNAEITTRGKAVSVSSRGNEVRLWELEGRSAAAVASSTSKSATSAALSSSPPSSFHGRSVEIKPVSTDKEGENPVVPSGWSDRRSWVGFDDERVIVLKESQERLESLMIYDFT